MLAAASTRAQTTRPVPGAMPFLDFSLPPALEAKEPPEARGLARDEVRLLVSCRAQQRLVHTHFYRLDRFLRPGDLLVINTSATRPASVPAERRDGLSLRLHLSTELPDGRWLVELRRPRGEATVSFREGKPGETIALPAGGRVTLQQARGPHRRLWEATVALPAPVDVYLGEHGEPIRYQYVEGEWPLACYQTVYATEPGSAEMPSAGRAFTPELLTRLVARGVQVAPIVLHTGVASLEADEPPYEEVYRVPATTARLVNGTHAHGGRVVAVGTTVVRALETEAGAAGTVTGGEGWTDLIITPRRGVRVVDALLTGLHEPKATHLAMLEALAGKEHLRHAYQEALQEEYLWHEFGDLHLILP